MLHPHLIMLALAAIALSAPGCGGSSHSQSAATAASTTSAATTTTTVATPPPPTATVKLASGRPLARAEWIARGEAICTRTNTQLSATTGGEREYPRVMPQLAVYEWTEAQELSKLVPPRAKTHDWAQIVKNLQLDGDYLNTLASYFQTKNKRAGYKLLETAERLHEHLNAIARRDGFSECTHTRVRRG
jgi:hypothetical protein